MPEARIDKWMWAARIFKTRTIAAEACKKGRISINGSQVKPARMVKPGDVVQVRKPPVTYSFKVLQAIEKGTLQNLIFDNQAFANHRAMAAVFGVILNLPPLKQALASKQFKSVYLDKLLSSAVNKSRKKK